MQAEKHRPAMPGQAESGPGLSPNKALETAQFSADGARKLQILAVTVVRLLRLPQQERLARKTKQRDARNRVRAIFHLILGRVGTA